MKTGESPGEVGDFRLIDLLGTGGMGEVWLARQRSVGRLVALKLLPAHLSEEPRAVLRFRREAEVGARLSHPHIASVYSAGLADGRLYIAQELVPGGRSVGDMIRDAGSHGVLAPEHFERVRRIVSIAALALHYAHRQGVVHRDIKPTNILLTADFTPKVADFGLAMMDDGFALSQSGDFAGTFAYMSPEQARARGAEIDHRSDVFSLGATLYEMLALSRPFQGESAYELFDRILNEAPTPPTEVRPEIPVDLAEACLRAIQKRREDRFQSMAEFARALGLVRTASASRARDGARSVPERRLTAAGGGGGATPATTRPRTPRLRKLLAGSAAALALALVVWLAVQRLPSDAEQSGVAQDLETLLERGLALSASPETIGEGIRILEEVASQDRAPADARHYLEIQLREGVDVLARARQVHEALSLARRLAELAPSAKADRKLADIEEQVREEHAGLVDLVAPTEGQTVASRDATLEARLTRPPRDETVTVAGELVELGEGLLRHELRGLEEGPNEVRLEVHHACGLTAARSIRFDVRTEAPRIEVMFPTRDQLVPGSFTASGTVASPLVARVRLGDREAAVEDGRWELDVELEAGARELSFTAVDELGRERTETVAVLCDTSPPVVHDPGRGFELYVTSETELVTLSVTDDHGLETVEWNDERVEPSADGRYELPIETWIREGQRQVHELRAVDLAGNEATQVVTTTVDKSRPELDLEPGIDEVLPGQAYALQGRVEDRSHCHVWIEGQEAISTDGNAFELFFPVPFEAVPGAKIELKVWARDAVANQAEATKTLLVIQPCRECRLVDGLRGDCSDCKGLGELTDKCAKTGCHEGSLSIDCAPCAGTGRATCDECKGEGRGKPEACKMGCTNGEKTCPVVCRGIPYEQDCRTCDGKGRVKKSAYDSNTCDDCRGAKKKVYPCAVCPNGTGLVPCNGGCEEGWTSPPCGQCTDGRTTKPCEPCKGEGGRLQDCPACVEGIETTRCSSCSGTGRCERCEGSGRYRRRVEH